MCERRLALRFGRGAVLFCRRATSFSNLSATGAAFFSAGADRFGWGRKGRAENASCGDLGLTFLEVLHERIEILVL